MPSNSQTKSAKYPFTYFDARILGKVARPLNPIFGSP